MRFTYPIGALVLGLVSVAPEGVRAQGQRPIAVPIIGSPAAQPQQPLPTSVPNPPASLLASPPAQAPATRGDRKLELSFKDGTVALDAQNVTLRDILMEWQRRDGC